MKPTLLARHRVISASERRPRSWPWTMTSPLVARSSPATRFSSVVLPDPDGPMSARYSPSATERSRSERTGITNSSRRYSLYQPFRVMEDASAMKEPLGLGEEIRHVGFRRLFGDPDFFQVLQGLR